MKTWRDTILDNFVPNISKLTLVADPDRLLTEEKMTLELQKRKFLILEFNDPIEFRYIYESQYRTIWDEGKHSELIVILHKPQLNTLPYDLLQKGRQLSFSLGHIFPLLNYSVIEKLDRSLLDKLFEAQHNSTQNRMGDNDTKDFILRHVFGISVNLITNEVELLHLFLRLHYGKTDTPKTLLKRLVQVLKKHHQFKNWPLSEITEDSKAFFAFLQERWPVFLSYLEQHPKKQEKLLEYHFKYSGPTHLPFDHQDIKIYINNLFLERKLIPVETTNTKANKTSWIRSGIIVTDVDDNEFRIPRLFELVEKEMPTEDTPHSQWITFAKKWAELSSLSHLSNNLEYQSQLRHMSNTLNTVFAQWLPKNYAHLINLSPSTPAMLHHVPHRLAHDFNDKNDAHIALIVVDGLALDQWVTMRQILQKQNKHLTMHETAVFAWIPTITPVSRQALFSGKPPLYFPSSIYSTHNEETQWKYFWEEQGLSPSCVAYKKSLSDGDPSSILETIIHPEKTKAIGLVIDKVDKIMHGMELGSPGMHNQITQWCQGEFLVKLINALLDYQYEIWLTSDHGNIQGSGIGRPIEGSTADLRGERVRVYPTPELRSQVAKNFPSAHEWDPTGLPSDYFPLIADNHDAFTQFEKDIVGHGGMTIEEVIVPLVKFQKKV